VFAQDSLKTVVKSWLRWSPRERSAEIQRS